MLRKIFWPVSSILMVILMLLVSCGPKATPAQVTPTPGAPAPAAAAPVPTPAPALTPAPAPAEKPKYGGNFNIIQPRLVEVFLPTVTPTDTPAFSGIIYEQLTTSDWTKGPAGTGETNYGDFTSGDIMKWDYVLGRLAETFETPEVGVWILNIRKGVHFALDPNNEASRLVNGREMTADDVVFSINRNLTHPMSSTLLRQPGLSKNAVIEKTGPWQVTVRTPVDMSVAYTYIMGGGSAQSVWPQEAVEKYWKTNDWRLTVGTGPYMLTDFVSASVATLVRNPNYWQKNPVGSGKGDQLPYPDGLKILIVPDLSTRLAATRTGRADWIDEIELEDAQSMLKTTPRLHSKGFIAFPTGVAMRTDKLDLPYKDVRVRQALHMAIDFEAIKNDLYEGQADILTFPIAPSVGTQHMYVPIEQLPESAKTLFKYNPERAKQLLAEAGYPNGFKAKMIVQNTSSEVDPAAVFKAMWSKIGVDVEIQPRETAVYNSIINARSYEEMVFRRVANLNVVNQRPFFASLRGPGPFNSSLVNDPPGKDTVIEVAFQEIQKNILINWPKVDQTTRDLIPYVLEQAYYIMRPQPRTFRFWQPWVKNYYGESAFNHWIEYLWIDQDLRESVTGKR